MKEYTVEQLYEQLPSFTDIYGDNAKDMPEGVNLTVYCSNGGDEEGFIENAKSDELGLHALIAKKWILQSDLDNLLANS